MGSSQTCNLLAFSNVHFLILIFLLPLIAANYRPLNELYILQPAGVAGSCDPMLSILEKSYGEGLAMAQLAVDAIDAVTYGQASNWVRTSKNIRKAKILQALFNIRAAGKLKPISAEDSASLLKVRRMNDSSQDEITINIALLIIPRRGLCHYDHNCKPKLQWAFSLILRR